MTPLVLPPVWSWWGLAVYGTLFFAFLLHTSMVFKWEERNAENARFLAGQVLMALLWIVVYSRSRS